MSGLLDTVRAIAEHAAARLPEDETRATVLAIRQRLAEPLRVAVAGRTSAGKSTLVNALLAQRVVPVGSGECTRVVTWLRYGEVDGAEAVLVDGTRRTVPLGRGRTLPLELGVQPDRVDRVEVQLYNAALESLVLIDTPGLESLSEGVSARTARLLGLGTGSALAQADALLYVVAGDVRDDDVGVLDDFARHTTAARSTAANTVLVVSKADRILHGGGPDAEARLESLLDRWRERLGLRVAAVTPIVGLLAETALSGALDEERAAQLRVLSAIPEAERGRWLVSRRRFLSAATTPAPADARADLLGLFDVYGLSQAAALGELGVTGAAALTRRFAEISGIAQLRAQIATSFVDRTGLLKADMALRALRVLTQAPDTPAASAAVIRDALVAHADALVAAPEAQRLRELELLFELSSGGLQLPDDLSSDVHRLATGMTFRQRLGLAPSATRAEGAGAAATAAARWRRFQFDGRRTPEERRAAHVVGLSLTRIAGELRGSEEAQAA